jgi:hypothetical protein
MNGSMELYSDEFNRYVAKYWRMYNEKIGATKSKTARNVHLIYWLACGVHNRKIWVLFPEEQEIFVFLTASRLILGPIQSGMWLVPGLLPSRVKHTRREAGRLLHGVVLSLAEGQIYC